MYGFVYIEQWMITCFLTVHNLLIYVVVWEKPWEKVWLNSVKQFENPRVRVNLTLILTLRLSYM